MIFVTVGNATQGFGRLLNKIDDLAGQGFFADEQVFIQAGNNSDFIASNCRQENFLSPDQFTEMIGNADLVISHAGAGTLIQVLGAGKIPVVMPRHQQYSEHVDDHQVELVKALASEGRVIPAYEPEDLPEAIISGQRRNRQPVPAQPSQMIALVSEAIEEIRQRKS